MTWNVFDDTYIGFHKNENCSYDNFSVCFAHTHTHGSKKMITSYFIPGARVTHEQFSVSDYHKSKGVMNQQVGYASIHDSKP